MKQVTLNCSVEDNIKLTEGQVESSISWKRAVSDEEAYPTLSQM